MQRTQYVKFVILTFFYFLIIHSYLNASQASSNLALSTNTIKITADYVESDPDSNVILSKDSVTVKYKDGILTADEVKYFTKESKLEAQGNVVLQEKNNIIEGENLVYYFETSQGIVANSRIFHAPWRAVGKKTERISREKVIIRNGYFTSCDYYKPHYKLKSKKIVLYLDKRIVAYNTFLLVHGVPLLYFPILYHSLKELKPEFNIVTGYNFYDGTFVKFRCTYPFTKRDKGTVYVDWFEKKGWGKGLKYEYQRDNLNGSIYGYHIEEDNKVDKEKITRWSTLVNHFHRITPHLNSVLRMQYQSDESFNENFVYTDSRSGVPAETNNLERINRDINSYFSMSYNKSKYSIFLAWDRQDQWESRLEKSDLSTLNVNTDNLWADLKANAYIDDNGKILLNFYNLVAYFDMIVGDSFRDIKKDLYFIIKDKTSKGIFRKHKEKLPELTFTTLNRNLFLKGFYYKYGFKLLNNYSYIKDSYYASGSCYATLLASQKINRNLNLNSSITLFEALTNTYIELEKQFKAEQSRYYTTNLSIREYFTRSIYINLSHIFTQYLREGDNLNARRILENLIAASLNARLFRKLNTTVGTSYNLNLREYNLKEIDPGNHLQLERMQPIVTTIRYTPNTKHFIYGRHTYNLLKQWTTFMQGIYSFTTKQWKLFEDIRYSPDQISEELDIISRLTFKLNSKWSLSAGVRFKNLREADVDIADKYNRVWRLTEQQYAIKRDLHCWETELSWKKITYNEEEIWFTFNIKAIPGQKINLQRNIAYNEVYEDWDEEIKFSGKN